MGEWRYSSTFLDLGTRWRSVVSFTSLPLYRRRKNLRDPLERRLGRSQSRSGRCGGEKNLPYRESNPVIVFIGLLKLVTTIIDSASANSHTLQHTTARNVSSQSAVSSPVVA
jgi:hypothetical protein